MLARDALSPVDACSVTVRVIISGLLGIRMCPDCPQCAMRGCLCMDTFGSNAEPMGGVIGRVDAIIGATQTQKAEGVFHMHCLAFVQMHINIVHLKRLDKLPVTGC